MGDHHPGRESQLDGYGAEQHLDHQEQRSQGRGISEPAVVPVISPRHGGHGQNYQADQGCGPPVADLDHGWKIERRKPLAVAPGPVVATAHPRAGYAYHPAEHDQERAEQDGADVVRVGDLIENVRRLLDSGRRAGVRVVHATYDGPLGGKQVSTAFLSDDTKRIGFLLVSALLVIGVRESARCPHRSARRYIMRLTRIILPLALATATAAGTLDQVPGWMHFLRIDADAGSSVWMHVAALLTFTGVFYFLAQRRLSA